MTRIDKSADKSESSKVVAYRKTLHKVAKAPAGHHDILEGEAAKLGIEIQKEESKAAPRQNSQFK